MDRTDFHSFNKFYSTHHEKCFLFTKSYVHNDLVAEDIISDAFIKLWGLWDNEEIDNPLKFLFVVLKNKSLDYLKHEKIKNQAFSSMSAQLQRELEIRISTLEASSLEKIFAEDIKDILRSTLASLPPQTREIFEMFRFKNMTKQEIADTYNISVKGVDYHISKSLARLKEELKDYYPLFLLFFNSL